MAFPQLMSVLQAVLGASKPVNELREIWSSLGTNAFLEAIVQDLNNSLRKSSLRTLQTRLQTNQRLALLSWRSRMKENVLATQLKKIKVIASKLLKEKRTQSRAPIVEIKRSKPVTKQEPVLETKTCEAPPSKYKQAHLRSQSHEFMETSEVLIASSIKKKCRQISKDWADRSHERRHSTEVSTGNSDTREPRFFSKLKSELQKKALSNATDVGTRLFNKAQEILHRKELLKQSYTPRYTFTPKLAPHTERRLTPRTPMKDAGINKEEIAVVSSSVGFRMGENSICN